MNDFSDTALIMVDDWHSNEFVCRFSLAWLYISTGIMISVNSTLTIDRAIAIISPFSRLKFQVMISLQNIDDDSCFVVVNHHQHHFFRAAFTDT